MIPRRVNVHGIRDSVGGADTVPPAPVIRRRRRRRRKLLERHDWKKIHDFGVRHLESSKIC